MPFFYCVCYVAAIGIAAHFIGNALPRRWFRPEAFPYRSFAWEREGKIYQKLGIRHWKDKVPDMSKFCGDMVRKEVAPRPTVEFLDRQIAETCVAECVHFWLILFSGGVLALYPGVGGWLVWAACLVGNLPFMLIQRYNRPRLLKMRRRLAR